MVENGQIIKPIYDSPLLNPREKILLRKRQHWFVLALSLFAIILIGIFLISMNYFMFFQIIHNYNLILAIDLIIFISISTITAKLIVDWHCHFYMLTNRRILEVSYKPLFANSINNVILNQVKSTEIDIEKRGLINHILDMGNVIITFDRPTHQEEFCIMNIKDPKSIGFLLADVLDMNKAELDLMETPIWYKTKNKERPYRITGELFPGRTMGTI